MKVLFTILILSSQFYSVRLSAQFNIDTAFEILKRIDYNSYVRKPVDSLFHHIPNNYDSLTIIGHHNGNYADEVFVTYPNSVVLVIHVNNFRYMNPYWDMAIQQQPNWDINLFKKEDIAFCSLARGPIYYIGCDKFYSH